MEFLNVNKKKRNVIESWYITLKRIAYISVFFGIIISVLLVLNYFQIKSVDPLQVKALSSLIQEIGDNPDNTQLKEQVRELDLISRKAFFINKWQVRTGSYLLLGLVIIFLIIMKNLSSLKIKYPDLKQAIDGQTGWENKFLLRKYLLATGISIFLIVLVFGLLSENELDKIGEKTLSLKTNTRDEGFIKKLRENWPGFRGPDGMGYSYAKNIPLEWDGDSGQNILWKLPIPLPGYNSPIFWEGKIYLSGADKKEQYVYCIDADKGEILWQKQISDVPGSPEKAPRTSSDTGFAAATMATDGNQVFVIFATGDLAALDLTGKIIWAKNLGVPNNHYGHSSSLLIYQNVILVQYDQNGGGHLIALNSANGDLVYEVQRPVQISWASPILVNTGKRDEVILNSNPLVISYDPLTGKELWQVHCMLGEVAPSLAYSNGMVFAVNENARLVGIKLDNPPKILWEYDDELSEVSSPIAINDILIMAASYGPVSCFDSTTGKQLWMNEYDRGFYSSPILVGDNIYLTDMKGTTYIFKGTKEFKEIAQNNLGEDVVTTPAFVGDKIYIRGYKSLFCIAEKGR